MSRDAELRPTNRLARAVPLLYSAWAVIAIGLSVAASGLSAENVTRLFTVAFLLAQLGLRERLAGRLAWLPPKTRFVVSCVLLAAVVEGFHMISRPVFPSLKVGPDTHGLTAAGFFGIDLLMTMPAYVVIFSVIWFFAGRYRWDVWTYSLVMGLAQTLGDGGIYFFAGSPGMLLFLPYPMTNYHAINVLPFLAVRDELRPDRPVDWTAYLAIPAVIATYALCGALIQWVGRAVGLA